MADYDVSHSSSNFDYDRHLSEMNRDASKFVKNYKLNEQGQFVKRSITSKVRGKVDYNEIIKGAGAIIEQHQISRGEKQPTAQDLTQSKNQMQLLHRYLQHYSTEAKTRNAPEAERLETRLNLASTEQSKAEVNALLGQTGLFDQPILKIFKNFGKVIISPTIAESTTAISSAPPGFLCIDVVKSHIDNSHRIIIRCDGYRSESKPDTRLSLNADDYHFRDSIRANAIERVRNHSALAPLVRAGNVVESSTAIPGKLCISIEHSSGTEAKVVLQYFDRRWECPVSQFNRDTFQPFAEETAQELKTELAFDPSGPTEEVRSQLVAHLKEGAFEGLSRLDQYRLLSASQSPTFREDREVQIASLQAESRRLSAVADKTPLQHHRLREVQLTLRNLHIRTPLPVTPSQEALERTKLDTRDFAAVAAAIAVPPADPSIAVQTIIPQAFERLQLRFPDGIQDDNGAMVPNSRVLANLQRDMAAVTQPGPYQISANPLRHWAKSIDDRQKSISTMPEGPDKEQAQKALDDELVEIFAETLGPAVLHCSDRVRQASELIYREKIQGEIVEEDLPTKFKKRAFTHTKDVFMEVARFQARSARVDMSTFAQVAFDMFGQEAGLPKEAAQSQFQGFRQYISPHRDAILTQFREASTGPKIADALKSMINMQQFHEFMGSRFSDWNEETDPDAEPGQEHYKHEDFLEYDSTGIPRGPNDKGILLMMQEMGIVEPFA